MGSGPLNRPRACYGKTVSAECVSSTVILCWIDLLTLWYSPTISHGSGAGLSQRLVPKVPAPEPGGTLSLWTPKVVCGGTAPKWCSTVLVSDGYKRFLSRARF